MIVTELQFFFDHNSKSSLTSNLVFSQTYWQEICCNLFDVSVTEKLLERLSFIPVRMNQTCNTSEDETIDSWREKKYADFDCFPVRYECFDCLRSTDNCSLKYLVGTIFSALFISPTVLHLSFFWVIFYLFLMNYYTTSSINMGNREHSFSWFLSEVSIAMRTLWQRLYRLDFTSCSHSSAVKIKYWQKQFLQGKWKV